MSVVPATFDEQGNLYPSRRMVEKLTVDNDVEYVQKHPPAGHVRSHAPADGEEYLYGNIGSACLMGLVWLASHTVAASVSSEVDASVVRRGAVPSLKCPMDPPANRICVVRPVVDLGEWIVSVGVVC